MTVTLQNLTQRYGATPSLHAIDLTVRPGEFLALVGPSGAGKTTVLRVIAGLESRYEGRLLIGGEDMAGIPARHRNIGFVFQNYALFRHMTVAENVAFGLRVRGRPRAAIASRVAELLELVQIPHLAQRRPAQLSGGQQQRVALARALATEPRLLLLDEPFGALDPLVRAEIRTWLRGLHDRLGLTSIFITHDQEEAVELADRVAVMRGGRILQLDTPEALEAHPADPFVFEFLGPTLGFDGIVQDGLLHITDLPMLPTRVHHTPGPTRALARPWNVTLLPGHGDARVTALHRAGPITWFTVQTGTRTLELATTETDRPRIGDTGSLAIQSARLFSTAAGAGTGSATKALAQAA
jgi:sulfate/thiosulfate transport system ATP-binding protein